MKRTFLIIALIFSLIFGYSQELPLDEVKISKADSVYNFSKLLDLPLYYNIPDSLLYKGYRYLKKKGEVNFQDFAYQKSISYFLAAALSTNNKKKQTYAYYNAALANFKRKDFKKATEFFFMTRALNTKGKKYKEVDYYLGRVSLYLANYLKAKKYFRDFTRAVGDDEKYALLKSNAYLQIRSCNFVLEQTNKNDEPQFNVFKLSDEINTYKSEYSPSLKRNELVFTRKENSGLSKIYTSWLNENDEITTQLFSSSLNFGKVSVGYPSFSPNGKIVYFSKCNVQNEAIIDCAIYVSYLKNGIWTTAKKMDALINEPKSQASYPNITINEHGEQVLFFSAERKRGRGGLDIWSVKIDSLGNVYDLKNVGYPINTKNDEISPYFNATTGHLYYSSDGKVSYGGFDVYRARLSGDVYEDEEHLDSTINSSLDDYGFIIDKRLEKGYFSSNREKTLRTYCCSDIYGFKTSDYNIFLKGDIYAENSTSRVKLKQADLLLVNLSENTSLDTSIIDGTYFLKLKKKSKYSLTAINSQFKDVSVSFSTIPFDESDTLNQNIYFKERTIEEPKLLAEIFYDLNKSKLTESAPESLAYVLLFLQNYPEARIVVKAYTDNIGEAVYNLALSEKRCKAAINYLVSNGINESRIYGEWYGEKMPKFSNESEAGRLKNRRTEFWLKAE